MSTIIAIYENGVFRPTHPVDLPEGTRVRIEAVPLPTEEPPERKPRPPGNCKGLLTIVADDEQHLKDFAEYME